MTDDQADQTVPKTIQFAFQNSAVFIAIGTLWLYLVATSYADGYLNFFGLGIAWFDVTPFRLLGFGYFPVLAVVVVTAIWWLVMASPMSERNPAMWCVVLSLWSAIVVAHAVVRSAAQVAKQDLPLLDIWGYLPRVAFECAVYVLLPLVVFLFFRYYLETHRIPRLWADWKATADALKSTLGEARTAVEKAKGTPEAERDFARLQYLDKELETKQNELETLWANIGTINKRFQKLRFMAIQTSPVADTIFPVILFSLMLIFFSYDFGFIVAYEAVTTKSSWRSQSQDNPTQLLFSDGKRTLESNTNNSRTLVTFRDPDANVLLEQNLGSLGKDPLHRLNPKQVPQRR